LAHAEQPITPTDTRETVYQKLYQLGGEVLPQVIIDFVQGKLSAQPQPADSPTPYSKRFTRDDSFVAWDGVQAAMTGETIEATQLAPLLATALTKNSNSPQTNDIFNAADLERATRALAGFPGLWTLIPTAKGPTRMKLLKTSLTGTKTGGQALQLDQVQIAGQQPATWNQVRTILK
jgi:methionyl-tRNA formyltransferase